MGSRKAAGPDHWRIQELLCLPEAAHANFVACITSDLQQGKVSPQLNHAAIAPIPKTAKETPTIGKIRPLSIYPIPFRAFLSAAWSLVKTEVRNLLDPAQFASRQGAWTYSMVSKQMAAVEL
eukprot:5443220-Amphidinium_carterae.1